MSDKKRKLTIHDLPWGTKFKMKNDPFVYITIGQGKFSRLHAVVREWQSNMEISEILDVGGWVSVDNMRHEDGQWWVSHG